MHIVVEGGDDFELALCATEVAGPPGALYFLARSRCPELIENHLRF